MNSEREIVTHLYESNTDKVNYKVSIMIIYPDDTSERKTFNVLASNNQEAINLAKKQANPRKIKGVLLRDIKII